MIIPSCKEKTEEKEEHNTPVVETFSLSFLGDHCEADNKDKFLADENVSFNITCEKYYTLPSYITCSGTDNYSYDSKTGKVSFSAHSDVVISCSANYIEPFVIVFNPNGGKIDSGDATQYFHEVSEIVPPVVSRLNYSFIGWDTDISKVTSSVTVNALWELNIVNPTELNLNGFNRDGDEFSLSFPPGTYDFNAKEYVEVGNNATWKSYYDYECTRHIENERIYNLQVGETTIFIKVTFEEESKVYKVKLYVKTTFWVTFEENGGSSVADLTVTEGDIISTVPVSNREGYSLTWDYDFTQPIKSSITVNAIWTPNVQTIQVSYNNEYGSVTGAGNYNYDSSATLIAEPKTNYKFVGFYEGDNLLGTDTTLVINPVHKDYQINAVFEEASKIYVHLFSTNLYFGTVDEELNGYSGSTVTIKAYENKPDTFVGWYINGELVSTDKEFSYTLGDSDITAYAYFKDKNTSINYYQNSETKELSMYKATGSDLYVPNFDLFNGDFYPVTSIATSENYNYEDLLYLYIPKTITQVHESAFRFVYSLLSVTFEGGHSLVLGNSAFEYCYDLAEVIMPNDLNISTIPDSVFSETSLTSFNLPASVKSIGYDSFSYCEQLKDFVINGNNLESIGQEAFLYSGLTSITLPDSLKVLDTDSFACCEELTTINFPSDNGNLTTIGQRAFSGCKNVTSINIPRCVTKLCYGAFLGCGMTEVFLPNTLKTIEGSVFCSCKKLKTIIFEDGFYMESLPEKMFRDCDALETFVVPDYIKSIDYQCFYDCDNLKTITFGKNTSVESFGDEAFSVSGLVSFELPPTLKTIGYSVFCECEQLTTVTIPATMTTLYAGLFDECDALTTVIFENPYTLTSIGNSAFNSCNSLKEFVVPDNVKFLGDTVFSACYSLEKITLNDSLTEIGYYCFNLCPSLEQIIIPSNVNRIGEGCFFQCDIDIYLESSSVPTDFDEDWNSGNDYYLYSETPNYDGNHWHYNSSNEPQIWVE